MTSARKWLGITVLGSALVVGVVFWEAITQDFAPQDVLRVFRYENLAAPDFKSCVSRFGKIYVLTGRPLMIVGECWEHASTEKVSNLKIGRGISVGLLIFAVVLLALWLMTYGASPPLALGTAAGIGVLPGLSFMVLQGGTAVFSIAGIPLALWGVHGVLSAIQGKRPRAKIAQAALPLLISLFCFPPFCFGALILGGAYYIWGKEPLKVRMITLAKLLLWFAMTVAVYFAVVKMWALLQYGSFSGAMDLRERNFKLSPASVFRWAPFLRDVLWTRFGLWSAKSPEHWLRLGIVVVVAANIALTWQRWRGQIGFGLGCVVLLLAASVPFIVSSMPLEQDAFRYCFSARALLVLYLGAGCYRLLKVVFPQRERLCALVSGGLLLFLAVPTASLRVSSTVKNSATEWSIAKEFGNEMLSKLELATQHHVHIIRPQKPFFGDDYRGEENTLALMANPEHVVQTVNAVLREGNERDVLKNIVVSTSYSESGESLPSSFPQKSPTSYLWDFSRVTTR